MRIKIFFISVIELVLVFIISVSYTSEINIYFTDPENNPPSLSQFSTQKKPIDFALKEFIETVPSGSTMYVCIYEINNTTITLAIDTVVNKNVKVYSIFHKDVSTGVFKSNFDWRKLGDSSKLMHNKFVVVKSSKVWSGSYNFTVSATYEQDNFAVEIFSKEIAEIYEKAFLYMWNSTGTITDFNGRQVTLSDGTKISVYFNPYSKTKELKDVLVENFYDKYEEKAKIKNLYFSVAWFNYDDIADILVLLKNKNVNICGIIDDDSMNFSVYQKLRSNQININFDSHTTSYGKGLMHHKFCILDPYGENPKVICGSSNWSFSALTSQGGNYENLIVIESREVAEIFYKEFLRLYNKAIPDQLITETDELVEEILFYPNPIKEKVNLKFKPNISVKEIKFLLVSLYGVKVFEQNLNFVLGVENKTEIVLPQDIKSGLYYAILRVKTVGYNKDYVKKIIVK
ncbi:MAG: phospholipase D-like domain-containing protein [Endomicrobiia bacterium]